MSEWNPVEMKALFEKKAKEKGCSYSAFVQTFANELLISRSALNGYLTKGSTGPKKSHIQKALYEKIKKELGYDILAKVPSQVDSKEVFVEDREQKLPEFCEKKLEEAFQRIYDYLMVAYNGGYTLLFERDCSPLLLYFEIYKPCMPNYLCKEFLEFLENRLSLMKEEARKNDGIIVFEGVGFFYECHLVDGKIVDEEDYELEEDYIDNNTEEHRTRILNLIRDVAEFWSKKVERLYPNGEGQATTIFKQFETSC